jgi:hypothetical protein
MARFKDRIRLAQEFLSFAMKNKTWWLIPILLLVGLLAAIVLVSSTAVAPLMYTVF